MNIVEINKLPCGFPDSDFGAVAEDNDIPHIDINEFAYSDFFEKYLFNNKPCVLRSVSNNWESSKYWVVDNKPNFEYFCKNYSK